MNHAGWQPCDPQRDDHHEGPRADTSSSSPSDPNVANGTLASGGHHQDDYFLLLQPTRTKTIITDNGCRIEVWPAHCCLSVGALFPPTAGKVR